MGRIIFAVGLAGIAFITAVAWRMANAQIGSCMYERACIIRLTQHRDAILTAGLSVALAFILASLIAFAVIRARQQQGRADPRARPASREQRPLPRS